MYGLSALIERLSVSVSQPGKQKKKFSSFFKSLVIELDKDLYGPDNHLVEVSPHMVPRGRGSFTMIQSYNNSF